MGIKVSPYEIIDCMRCGKSEFVGNAEGWNTVFDKGVIVGHICPGCQTDEEDIEAQVNEALTDYSNVKAVRNLDDLLNLFRPLWVGDLRIIANGETERGNNLLSEHLERFMNGYNALFRDDPDNQIKDIKAAYSKLVELGELPKR